MLDSGRDLRFPPTLAPAGFGREDEPAAAMVHERVASIVEVRGGDTVA